MTTILMLIFAAAGAVRLAKLGMAAVYILSSRKRTAQMGRLMVEAFERGRNQSRARRYVSR